MRPTAEMPIRGANPLAPVRARTSINPEELERLVGETLKKLGFAARLNRGRGVTEFEVVSPCNFLVRVEDITRERLSFGFRSRIKVESAIELYPTVGSRDPKEEVERRASEFLTALRAVVPPEPWKGLGLMGSRAEKANWELLGRL